MTSKTEKSGSLYSRLLTWASRLQICIRAQTWELNTFSTWQDLARNSNHKAYLRCINQTTIILIHWGYSSLILSMLLLLPRKQKSFWPFRTLAEFLYLGGKSFYFCRLQHSLSWSCRRGRFWYKLGLLKTNMKEDKTESQECYEKH